MVMVSEYVQAQDGGARRTVDGERSHGTIGKNWRMVCWWMSSVPGYHGDYIESHCSKQGTAEGEEIAR